MGKILVLIGSPQFAEKSLSTTAATYFVEQYKIAHSDDDIEIIRIADLPEIRFTATILAGTPTETDMAILANRGALLEKYKAADKIVVATPMWDFSLPGSVKEVLDTFCAAGQTFRYLEVPDEFGNVSAPLTPAKKLLFIQAMGGFHKDTHGDISFAQVKAIFNFLGDTEIDYVALQGSGIPGVDALGAAKKELDIILQTF